MIYKELLILASLTAVISSCGRYQQSNDATVQRTYVHRYGVEVPPGEWVERGADGEVVSTLNTGVVVTRSYSGGVLHGETRYTFPHSDSIAKKETYNQENLTKDVAYYSSGTPMKETRHEAEGKTITTWYEVGTPRSIEEYDAQDKLVHAEYYDIHHEEEARVDAGTGTRIIRDPYGNKVSTDAIKDGAMITRTLYYPNGAIKSITPYQDGVVQGKRKTFFITGEPQTIEEWAADKQQGITLAYQNGEKQAEILYVNGLKNGLERRFRDGATVVEEISWKDDQQYGPSTRFVGNTAQTQWYYYGQPVPKPKFDMLVGSLSR